MEKLELKYIAPYLPYKVEYESNGEIETLKSVDTGLKMVNFGWGNAKKFEEIKPILRPLSGLTKKIEVNGERFIPIISLSRYVDNGHNHIDSTYHKSSNYITVLTQKCDDVENVKFRFTIEGISSIERSGEVVSFVTYDKIKLKLLEWHFDIYGLIEKGLAIDKNTL